MFEDKVELFIFLLETQTRWFSTKISDPQEK